MEYNEIKDNQVEFQRAKILFERNSLIHIKKKDGMFYNGLIIELNPDFLIMKSLSGQEEVVLFREIKGNISLYKPLEETK